MECNSRFKKGKGIDQQDVRIIYTLYKNKNKRR